MEIFRIMYGLPVTVRLLDPPLHEFLPRSGKEIADVAKVVETDFNVVKSRIDELHELNPMLGHRGCRLEYLFLKFMRCNVGQFLRLCQNSKKINKSLLFQK